MSRLNGRRAEAEAQGLRINVAILGAGRIAHSMARTLVAMAADPRYAGLVAPYAVAARDGGRAAAFAAEYGCPVSYGSYDELLADPERVMSEGLEAFAPKYRADGALLIQAHPFRGKCTPAPAELLDGVEVLNLNPRHDSRNDLALAYAEEHHLLMTAGSDCHRPGDEGTTGILAETLPEDSFGYADLIRSGKYTLIRPE